MKQTGLLLIFIAFAMGCTLYWWNSAIPELDSSTFAGNFVCTIGSTSFGGASSGTIYFSDGRGRGDYTIVEKGKKYQVHVIRRDGFVYNWCDHLPYGSKELIVEATVRGDKTLALTVDGNFSCKSTLRTDQTKFDLPRNIEFRLSDDSRSPSRALFE